MAEKKEKKWRGKEWFKVLAPSKLFEGTVLGEIPATDPKSLVGRNVERSISDITGNQAKSHIRLKFKITDVKGSQANTTFNQYYVIREYISRVLRKRLQKVELVNKIEVKDGQVLKAKTVVILNRNTPTSVQKRVRAEIENFLKNTAEKTTLEDFIKFVTLGSVQKNLKKMCNKIYPVRFCEISKLELLKKA